MALYQFEERKPRIGKGTFIAESALVIGDVRIGKDSYIGHGVITVRSLLEMRLPLKKA
jgi:carbonic anhydrase/acetyltransferase-like protein (isoleucine patch superfamily)